MARKETHQPLEMVRKSLAVRIAELRAENGMTQHQFAEKSGLALQYLTKIERGERSPSLKTLVVLASALDVPIVELFNFEEREISSPRVNCRTLSFDVG